MTDAVEHPRLTGVSDNWGTPSWLAELARYVLGGIGLDPCSTEADNEIVGAKTIITAEQDGLKTPWREVPAMVNPPGGRSALVRAFWARACVHDAPVFWVGFNLGQLRYLDPTPVVAPGFCILKSRVAFRDPEARGRTAGRYDNYLALTGRCDLDVIRRFTEAVAPFQTVTLVNGDAWNDLI